MSNIKETLRQLNECFKSEEFIANRKTGDYFVRTYMDMSFLGWLYKRDVIGVLECNTLALALNKDAQPLNRGSKSKIKRLLIRKIKPFVESELKQDSIKDEQFELPLPTVDDILKEVRESKLPVKITGTTKKQSKNSMETKTETSITIDEQSIEQEQLVKEDTQEIKEDTQEARDLYLKGIMTANQLILFKQFKNKTYQRNNIEVLPNLKVGCIIDGAEQLQNEAIDIIITDKNKLSLICAVLIVDSNFKPEVLQLLNQLEIKTFIIPLEDGILNTGSIRAVEEHINNMYAPICSMCGLPMRQRENMKTRHRFYACLDNKNCRHTIDMGD